MNKINKITGNAFTSGIVILFERITNNGESNNIVTYQTRLTSGASAHHRHHFGCYLKMALGTLVLSSLPLLAKAGELITFPGSSLQTAPFFGQANSLFPIASLSENRVTINSGNIGGSIFGGISTDNADVFNNTVTVSGGSVNGDIYGGYSVGGNAVNNRIIITNNTITEISGDIYGGFSQSGYANGNSVTVSGGTINNNVIGGMTLVTSGVAGNKVTVSGNAVVNGMIVGGIGVGNVTGNTVTISDNASVKDVFGGFVNNGAGQTNGNNVIMIGGKVERDIIGGFGRNYGAPSIGNHVNISGGTVGGNVFGGFSRSQVAIDNIITLSGNPQFSADNTWLYGGISASVYQDVFSGNTLNFGAQPIAVNKVANFQYYNFMLDPALANTSSSLINSDTIMLGNEAGTTPSSFAVVGIYSGQALQADDTFLLIQANTMSGYVESTTSRGVAQQGISLLYDIRTDVNLTNNEVTATILNATGRNSNNPEGGDSGGNSNKKPAVAVNPQLRALPAGYLAGIQLVTRGADMIVDDVFGAIKVQEQEQGLHLFTVASADHSRYKSGSDIKSNDFLLTVGVNYQYNNVTIGTFVEGGFGNYDTHNSFYNTKNVHGDGNNRYYGVGLLGRYDFDNGFYTDATIRFGQNKNKFDTKDIVNLTTGQFASYNVRSNYVSAHIGSGYTLQLNDKSQLDLSAKYLWTQLGGKDVNVAGDNIHFDRINSNRVRLNTILNHKYSDGVILNAGLGYEHEFNGKARATTYGIYNIDAVSVKGDTYILSFGMSVKPTSNHNLTFDFKGNGYTGKREGIGASVRVNYAF